jgi:hypothetical protein
MDILDVSFTACFLCILQIVRYNYGFAHDPDLGIVLFLGGQYRSLREIIAIRCVRATSQFYDLDIYVFFMW